MAEQRFVVVDVESKSKLSLPDVGAYDYARHPSTRFICICWRSGTRDNIGKAKIFRWSPYFPDAFDSLDELIFALLDRENRLVAHNALFEQVMIRYVLPRYTSSENFRRLLRCIPIDRWECTAAGAAAMALPRDLRGACIALKLPVQKDDEGSRLIKKYCKPRKPTKNNPHIWHRKKRDILRLIEYCATDVRAQTGLFLALPPLTEREREVWKLDQEVNWRGIHVARPLVKKILGMISEESRSLQEQTAKLTKGAVTSTTKVKATKDWLEEHDCFLPNLQKKTIEDALAEMDLNPEARKLLEIRQAASMSSTAKYLGFWMRSSVDSTVRDILKYHGASTGRFTGAGLQVHNFPRGKIDDTWGACDLIRWSTLEELRLLYPNPMELFSSCLRSMIVPHPGNWFFGGDFSSIEVRVLFWLAGHDDGLDAYREGRDLYLELAAVIYGIKFEELKRRYKEEDAEAIEMREVAKRAVLGCGYGMGWKKFGMTCKQFGQAVSTRLAKKAVDAYRGTHEPVPQLWADVEAAAINAVKKPGKVFTAGRCLWWVEKNTLWCELPSGRRLAYYGPSLKMRPTPWGELRPCLYHWGVHPKTKQWVNDHTYGGKLVENITQAIARDIMVDSCLRVRRAGYKIALTVHDELLSERKKSRGSRDHFRALMSQTEKWSREIPIEVKAWDGPRYGKVKGT